MNCFLREFMYFLISIRYVMFLEFVQ